MIDVKKVEDFEKLTTSLNNIASAIENMPTSDKINYSTEEQNTGLKWIDGNTIYQKSIEITSFSSSILVISNIDILVYAEGVLTNGQNQWFAPYNDNDYAMFVKDPNDNVKLVLSSWFVNNLTGAIITVRYTKL